MTTIELICKKENVKRDSRVIRYSDFSSGDEFSILFKKNEKKMYVYDSINVDPEELDLNMYDYIVINHYIHYTIDEMIAIYKEYVNSLRVINSSKKFTLNFNEKMSFEKLKDSLNDNWRKDIVENLFGKIEELEEKIEGEDSIIDSYNDNLNSYEKENVEV